MRGIFYILFEMEKDYDRNEEIMEYELNLERKMNGESIDKEVEVFIIENKI